MMKIVLFDMYIITGTASATSFTLYLLITWIMRVDMDNIWQIFNCFFEANIFLKELIFLSNGGGGGVALNTVTAGYTLWMIILYFIIIIIIWGKYLTLNEIFKIYGFKTSLLFLAQIGHEKKYSSTE